MKYFQFLIVGLFLVACTPIQGSSDMLLVSVVRGGLFGLLFEHSTYTVRVDGTGETHANLLSGLGTKPRWSRDGRWIVFANDTSNTVTFVSADGSRRTQYQPNTSSIRDPSWSPDGTHIAYTAFGEQGYGIYTLNVACLLQGEKCQPIPIFLTEGDFPEWSPRGDQITYVEIVHAVSQIFTVTVGGGNTPVNLAPTLKNCAFTQWSPDGQRIVFSCRGDIYIINADGSGMTKLEEPGVFPTWSPDGSKIAFISSRDGLGKCIGGLCSSGGIFSNAVFLMNADGSNVIRLSKRNDEEVLWYTWLPSKSTIKP